MNQENIIARGAEAVIIKKGNYVIKNRVEKSYRHPIIDEKLRKSRTKAEAKLLEKASTIIHVPKVLKTDEQRKTIELEFINGKKLSDSLEKLNFISVCKQIGKSLEDNKTKDSKKHQSENYNINDKSVHEKLDKVYFIDFGLGFHSNKIEDKAVDLHLIKEALEAKHPSIYEQAFKAILAGYKSSINYNKVLKQLEAVEKRGRYKAQY